MIMKKTIIAGAIAIISTSAHAENKNLTQFGDMAQFGIPITAGIIALWKDDTEGLYQLTEGAIYTSLATHTLKWTINADRPDNTDNNSFPSGHTSSSAQGAAFLQFRYGWKYGLPAYAASAIVGYSRIKAQKHYWRDVVAGAALATGIQYTITKMGYSVTNVLFTPYENNNEIGLYANMKF